MREPQGPGIRVDSGIYSGYEVSPYYDPILSKVIAWGGGREAARRKIVEALGQYVILGIKTPMRFLVDVLEHPEFIKGNISTNFIAQYMEGWKEKGAKFVDEAVIAAAVSLCGKSKSHRASAGAKGIPSPWQTVGKWGL